MPHVIVKLGPGQPEARKVRLAEAIARDVLGSGEESVSVAFEEVGARDWSEQVYRPDVVETSATLYEKPGYSMRGREQRRSHGMKLPPRPIAAAVLAGASAAWLVVASPAATGRAGAPAAQGHQPAGTTKEVAVVSPALERYTQTIVMGDLWRRPDLSPRDRSLVTLAALIARNHATELPDYLELALDSGVKPREVSEVITHLAFYSGWGNARAATAAARGVFTRRGIGADQLPAASPHLLPLDEAAEADRKARVEQQFGAVAPGVVRYTTDLLFRDLWLRPDLAPRDRSLVTVSSLIASGQVAQMPYHLNRAMDNGLTRAEASEVMTHLAFHVGWPNVFSALPVAKDVFEKLPR